MPDNPSREVIETGLRRAWYPVARIVDLDTPQSADLLGERLVAFRTQTGAAAVVDRRCPHRGGDLAAGAVIGDAIECPYHGWQFGSDGGCRLIPALGDKPVPSQAKVRSYPAEERFGLVWTCLEEPFCVMPDLPEVEPLEMTYLAGEGIDTSAGMLAALENFRDVAHFPFVHRHSMGDVPHEVEPLDVKRDGFETWLTRSYSASEGAAEVYRDQENVTFTYHGVLPSLVSARLDYGPEVGQRIVLECFAPVDVAGGCRIYLVSGTAADYTGATGEEALEAELGVLIEDKPILDGLVPPEIPLHDEAIEISVASDRYTLTSRQAYISFCEEAAANAQPNEDAVASAVS